jgi:hypothetical protein
MRLCRPRLEPKLLENPEEGYSALQTLKISANLAKDQYSAVTLR